MSDALIMDDQIGDNVKREATEDEKKENEVKLVDHIQEKMRSKDEKNKRKEEKKSAEQFLKGLNDVHSVENKLEVMCKKYSEVVDENRKLQMTLKQYDKKILTLQREKEQFQSDRNKAALTRGRLENLCRELQKQNKAVKEESLLKIREQERMRRELTDKFQASLAQIKVLINSNNEKNAKLCEQNMQISKDFESACKEFQIREQECIEVYEGAKIRLQMAKMRHAEDKIEATAEKEALLKEKQQLLYQLKECQVQIRELQATEVGLRSQISTYTDKYDEFQNALTRSNKVYGEFNEEMERMSKKIVMLEKETTLWKQRWEDSHAALLKTEANKQMADSEMETLNRKLLLLQDLCKAFQYERTDLLAQLKAKTKSESEATATPDSRENSKTIKQVDQLSKDCTELQDIFGELQMSLSKVSETIEESVKDESNEIGIAEQKENTESSQKDSEASDSKPGDKETDRLESKSIDAKQETSTGENSRTSDETSNDFNEVTESLEMEKRDSLDPLKEENLTEKLSINGTETLNTEEIDTGSIEEKCSLVLNSDAIRESSTKSEDCRVESTDSTTCGDKQIVELQAGELSRLTEENNVELTNKNVRSRTIQGASEAANSSLQNLHEEVKSLHLETETIIEQLYEAIDSVRQENLEDGEETLKNTVNNKNKAAPVKNGKRRKR